MMADNNPSSTGKHRRPFLLIFLLVGLLPFLHAFSTTEQSSTSSSVLRRRPRRYCSSRHHPLWGGDKVVSSWDPATTNTMNHRTSNSRSRSKVVLSLSSKSSSVLAAASDIPRGGGSSGNADGDDQTTPAWKQKFQKIQTFVDKNFFLVGMFVAVAMAKAFPTLGTNGGILRPELFIGKYGVTFIFLLSGLSLELKQIAKAASNVKLNTLIQIMTFLAWPFLIGVPLIKAINLLFPTFFPQPLLDGLLMMMCLPTTVNMCVILTSTAGGNVATALYNAVVSNLGGIFITPALFFYFFGCSHIDLPFLDMLRKLSGKVLLPVAIGQALRITNLKNFYNRHSKIFKRMQELILLSILWNAFCSAFSSSLGLELKHAGALLLLLPALQGFSLAVLFGFFALPALNFDRGEVVAAMFCSSQKTLAFGLPLIQTVFESSSNLAAYSAPLMFIHPLQLIIGSMLIPRLEKYTAGGNNGQQKDG